MILSLIIDDNLPCESYFVLLLRIDDNITLYNSLTYIDNSADLHFSQYIDKYEFIDKTCTLKVSKGLYLSIAYVLEKLKPHRKSPAALSYAARYRDALHNDKINYWHNLSNHEHDGAFIIKFHYWIRDTYAYVYKNTIYDMISIYTYTHE